MLLANTVHFLQGILKRSRRNGRRPKASVANCPPPTKDDDLLEIGGYCIHASSNLYDLENNRVKYILGGYDDNPTIASKVDGACARMRDHLNANEKTERYSCVDHRLFFMGEREPCSGQIYLMNSNKDIISHINDAYN